MDDLPSLSFPTPWHGGQRGKNPSSSKGRVRVQYKALEEMDDIPLMSGEERELYTDEEGEDSEGDTVIFDQLGGRQRWQRRIRSRSTLFNLICDGGWPVILRNCLCAVVKVCCRGKPLKSRTVTLGHVDAAVKFPSNRICNQKYNLLTFIPKVLFQQFKFFLNLYFLVIALTQFIPQLRIGYLYTYWGPLGFVVAVTMLRELYDDLKRFVRDREVNGQRYYKLTVKGCSCQVSLQQDMQPKSTIYSPLYPRSVNASPSPSSTSYSDKE